MKYLQLILVFVVFPLFAQQNIDLKFISKEKSNLQTFAGIDNFGDFYHYNQQNIYIQRKSGKTIDFADIQLGNITSVDGFNRLKINAFYTDFNTVLILDNRLNEIYRINFNEITPYRNVSHVSTGYDNAIWIYNQDTQQLELFDYKQRITKAKTLPIANTVLGLVSNYNFVWLLTEDYLISYSYFGSMVSKMKNDGYTDLIEINENIILKKDNKLFYLSGDYNNIIPLNLPELLIKAFFATDETLYIYDGEYLHQYQLKTT